MNNLVIVRGGGDVATGTIYKLYQCGFRVLVLETQNPSAIRRHVAFCEAVYQGTQTVEDLTCTLASSLDEAKTLLEKGQLVMVIDPKGDSIKECEPIAVVDAILAKKNLGTTREMANIVIGLGPGFEAGVDVDAVIETMRGNSLGKVIYQGKAIANTGVPGEIAGFSKERVIHSPAVGTLKSIRKIGDVVKKEEVLAYIENENESVPVRTTMDGLLRGLIRDGYQVKQGLKIADIDPRLDEYENCFCISDKARCVAGGVVEAILHLRG